MCVHIAFAYDLYMCVLNDIHVYTQWGAYMWFPVYACDIVYAMQCLYFCECTSTCSMCLSCLDIYSILYDMCQSHCVWYEHIACVLLQYIVSMRILPVYVMCVVCAGMCCVFFYDTCACVLCV